jgi:uncharacterized protein
MRLSDYTVIVKPEESQRAVLFNGCTGAIDVVSPDIAEVLANSYIQDGLNTELKHELLRRGHLVDVNIDDINCQREIVKRLGLWLHQRNLQTSGFFLIPTYSCQMRCYYCCQQKRWDLDEDDQKKMSFGDVNSAFSVIKKLNSNGIKSLNLYGGEPLQFENYDLIKHIVSLSSNENYLLAVTTNGLESNKFINLFGIGKIQGVCFSVHGIPGDEEWDRLNANVEGALSRGASVAIRINVDTKTIKRLDEIFERARSYRWFDHPRLSWNVCPILPPEHPPKFEVIQPEEYESYVLKMKSNGLIPASVEFDLSAGRQIDSILKRGIPNPIHPRHPSFCGSKQGIYVFDPYGRIYTCHEGVGDPEFSVGRYFPELTLDNIRLRQQSEWIPSSHSECLSCPFVLMCGGGCLHRSDRDEFYCRWMKTSVRLALISYLNGSQKTHQGWL